MTGTRSGDGCITIKHQMQHFAFTAAKQNRKVNYEAPLRIYLSYQRGLPIGRVPLKHLKVQKSKCHQDIDVNQVIIVLPAMTRDIGEACSEAHAYQKSENRSMLLKILKNIRFLGRRGLALRGHDDTENNFVQLLKL